MHPTVLNLKVSGESNAAVKAPRLVNGETRVEKIFRRSLGFLRCFGDKTR